MGPRQCCAVYYVCVQDPRRPDAASWYDARCQLPVAVAHACLRLPAAPFHAQPADMILLAQAGITQYFAFRRPCALFDDFCRWHLILRQATFWLRRERKNVNLPGVVVDLPTLTAKDETDLVHWGLPNDIDFIAASFVRKGSDLDYIRKVRGVSQWRGQAIHAI